MPAWRLSIGTAIRPSPGADSIEERFGFTYLLERLEGNGVKTIIVGATSRYARNLVLQEAGFHELPRLGYDLNAADSPSLLLEKTPTVDLIRQVLVAVLQFERVLLVAELKDARDRKRRDTGKCEGRKSHTEERPRTIVLGKKLHWAGPKTGKRLSLDKISAALAEASHWAKQRLFFNPRSVKTMVKR